MIQQTHILNILYIFKEGIIIETVLLLCYYFMLCHIMLYVMLYAI